MEFLMNFYWYSVFMMPLENQVFKSKNIFPAHFPNTNSPKSNALAKSHAFFFCSTSLPLTSTRLVRSTIKLFALSTLTLSSALSINLGNINYFFEDKPFGKISRIEPGAAGWEARMQSFVLCGPRTTHHMHSWAGRADCTGLASQARFWGKGSCILL